MSLRALYFCLSATIFLALTACNGDEDSADTRMVVLKVLGPQKNAQFIEGQDVALKLDIKNDNPEAKLSILLNGDVLHEQQGVKTAEAYTIFSEKVKLGYNDIEIILDGFDDKKHSDKRQVIVFANSEPELLLPEIQRSLPHNAKHYTQGYEFSSGRLYEGTGQLGQSMVAEIELNSGAAIRKVENESNVFGEGITILNDEIYQLTWQSRMCYVYDLKDFSKKKQYSYDGEGWGIANDGEVLYMSNGSSKITVRNPKTFEIIRSFDVFSNRQEYRALNELEFVDGFLYANVYQQNYILKIDPKDGRVVGLIDCEELVQLGRGKGEVLNGIAYNAQNKRFYLTGKYWDKVFEVQLKPKSEI